ncbi:hypothetical protein F2Q68_00036378 [Brassica cretica]|uniref:RPW8 domain-containing protein n=1 Tax=Brassica cretica TaxID=69181 RepID=A0A8S9H9I5_BRACR|nr:hypothetical protein F2Q68_00036378 [Brassica cretica]
MNDVVSLGVGSVAGAVVSELLKVVIEEAKMVLTFKSVYMELASTMEDVLPIMEEIEMLPGAGELKKFKDIINEARVLVRKCSQVKRWNLPSKAKYTRKIEEINKKMLKYCQIQLQLIMFRNQRLIMHQKGWFACENIPDEVSTLPSDMLSDMPPNVPSDCLPVYTREAIESHLKSIKKKLDYFSVSPPVYVDLCSVPKLDKVLVGLDLPLMEVKKKFLGDDDLVVSAPPGCGKTTLVTQLCHDDEIKEKFEYIFFCDVSRVPTFRIIVQTLLQHSGYEAPTFENDSQAVGGLRKLIEELKEDGIKDTKPISHNEALVFQAQVKPELKPSFDLSVFSPSSVLSNGKKIETTAGRCTVKVQSQIQLHNRFGALGSRALTIIVQTLLQHSGYEAPTFENDSQAVGGLRKLIEELKEDGIKDTKPISHNEALVFQAQVKPEPRPSFDLSVLSPFSVLFNGKKIETTAGRCTVKVQSQIQLHNRFGALGSRALTYGPILLVLDDVWLGADSFLQKFQINIQDFKILVTSRFEISRKHEDLIQKTLKCCYGLPLLIEVIDVQLVRKSIDCLEVISWSEEETVLYHQLIRKLVNWATGKVKSWFEEKTILDNPQPNVIECLQPSLNVLKPHLKDCFLDIGSFLTQGKIRVSSIIDICMELYGKGSESSTVYVKYLNELAFRNLLALDPPSKSEEHHERERLNLEIREDAFPDWCLDLMQPISARLLSISTDDLFSSTWAEMECPNVEALALNLSSSSYALPNFIATMKM